MRSPRGDIPPSRGHHRPASCLSVPQGKRKSGWACTSRVRGPGRQLPLPPCAGEGGPQRAAWHRSIRFSFGAVIHDHCVDRPPRRAELCGASHTPHTMTPPSEKSSPLTNWPVPGSHYANGVGRRKGFSNERASKTCIPFVCLFVCLYLEG